LENLFIGGPVRLGQGDIMNKLAIVLVGLLGLAMVGYAVASPGAISTGLAGVGARLGMGSGPMHGFGGQIAKGPSPRVNMTVADRAALLQASYEGNYDTAEAVLQKYGLNSTKGAMSKDLFDAQAKINQAILNKDWTGAVQAQDALRIQHQADMQAQVASMVSKMNNAASSSTPSDTGFRMGMRGNRMFGRGLRGPGNSTAATNATASS